MRWFLTSDTHFWHDNIRKYAKRPFGSVEGMNAALIDNWNHVVKPGDAVIHCGDFAFAKRKEDVESILRQLHGQIHLIRGNHDRSSVLKASGFASIRELHRFKPSMGVEVVACHYAMKVWDKSHHGSYHAYGHSHNTLPDDPRSRSMDVGVDARNYFPISLDEFISILRNKEYVPVDSHGEEESDE